MTRRYWVPLGAYPAYDVPPPGAVIAREHAVWRITAVTDTPLTDKDREVWLDANMPDLATWRGRPRQVDVEWVGGARPDWAKPDGPVQPARLTLPAATYRSDAWYAYPTGRWAQCSCCGEPMPCRAKIQDDEVEAGLKRVEKLTSRVPGACWACEEPVTRRQKAVRYPGENLDLPGGPEPTFHTRQQCVGAAQAYERRWVAEDPRRERILTYPKCGGNLIVHADGSSECQSGMKPLGGDAVSERECEGHLTHDHAVFAACYVGDAWLEHPSQMPGCPRGCSREDHPGTRTSPRPERRQSATAPGLPL